MRCKAAASGSGVSAPQPASRLYLRGGCGGSAAAAASAAAASGAAALDAGSCSVTPTGWHPLDTPAIWKAGSVGGTGWLMAGCICVFGGAAHICAR